MKNSLPEQVRTSALLLEVEPRGFPKTHFKYFGENKNYLNEPKAKTRVNVSLMISDKCYAMLLLRIVHKSG
jgi:hypothetical protein